MPRSLEQSEPWRIDIADLSASYVAVGDPVPIMVDAYEVWEPPSPLSHVSALTPPSSPVSHASPVTPCLPTSYDEQPRQTLSKVVLSAHASAMSVSDTDPASLGGERFCCVATVAAENGSQCKFPSMNGSACTPTHANAATDVSSSLCAPRANAAANAAMDAKRAHMQVAIDMELVRVFNENAENIARAARSTGCATGQRKNPQDSEDAWHGACASSADDWSAGWQPPEYEADDWSAGWHGHAHRVRVRGRGSSAKFMRRFDPNEV
jgi:hypothetical protein